MILLQEPGYRIHWISPIPLINGVEATREELIGIFNTRHGLCGSVNSTPLGQSKSSSKEKLK